MIPDVFLEWENDFVLRRTEEHLHTLEDKWKDIPQLELLLNPQDRFDVAGTQVTPKFDDLRNESQIDAIQKAINNNITFIWGPPGTGKTATIGYIIANFLRLGKRVLFVSNTNRAVDVGLLNVMDALYEIHPEFDLQNTTRFGDAWIDDERLETVLFEHQVKEKLDSRKSEAVELSQLLSQFEAIQDQVDELMENEKEVPQALDLQAQLLGKKIDLFGGKLELEGKIDRLLNLNERYELKKKQLVATTMAKSVHRSCFTISAMMQLLWMNLRWQVFLIYY